MTDDFQAVCARCGHTDTLDGFDCGGLPDGWLACNQCGATFGPDGEQPPIHPGWTSTTTPGGIVQFEPEACEPINMAPVRQPPPEDEQKTLF